MIKALITSLMFLIGSSFALCECDLPWRARHAEGWAWYHDLPQKKKAEEPAPIITDPIKVLAEAKMNLERALAIAMLEPTNENVLAYMILQKRWIDQSAYFAQKWQINILEHPELASLMPTTQYGVQVRKEVDTAIRKKLIQDLAQNQTLLFFYKGGDPFSQAFAAVIQDFSKQYVWPIKAISVDGIILKNFPQSISDNSIAHEMKVSFFPALFCVNITTLKATPIAFGMVTTRQIEDNIAMQFGDKYE